MKANFKLNVNLLNSVVITQNVAITWENIESKINFSDWFQNEDIIGLNLTSSSKIFFAEYSSGGGQSIDSNFNTLSTNGNWISFIAETDSNISNIEYLLSLGVIEILPIQNQTLFFAYTQNSENNALSKNLSLVTIIYGKFNQVVGLKNIDIDIHEYERNYNYIYIPIFNRYYYVDSIEFISADFTRLHLKEDVLVSWKDLIKQQDAFITRMQYSRNRKLVDNRFPIEDTLKVEYVLPTPTAVGTTKVNTSFSTNIANNGWKILVSSISSAPHESLQTPAPSGTTLPTLTGLMAKCERVGFLSLDQLESLIYACLDDDNITTFINAVILLPFNPYITYNSYGGNAWLQDAPIQANNKFLCTDGKFHTSEEMQQQGYIAVRGSQSYLGATPYFVVQDFTLPETREDNATLSYLEYEPYTTIELYVAFVGWVKLNNSQVLGKRLLVYYTIDYKTGMGTAYIYNYTDDKLIYSTNCQFGIKLDLTTTNSTEITRQKQANELNMILGLMTSALSIGVGVATENPVAVAGGILGAGKTIASAVNSNKMLFERAQTSFGTSEGVFHSPISYAGYLRYSYHDTIITDNNSIYAKTQGYPANTYRSISTIPSGYIEVGEIHFDPKNNIIYQDEISEIVELLKNGVII